jgi:hypothetical protein
MNNPRINSQLSYNHDRQGGVLYLQESKKDSDRVTNQAVIQNTKVSDQATSQRKDSDVHTSLEKRIGERTQSLK